jgi:hypothetical protein
MATRRQPGTVRDAIMGYLARVDGDASITDIYTAVCNELGVNVPRSSVRSYLNINTPLIFTRTARGHYRMARGEQFLHLPSSHSSQLRLYALARVLC